jgi:hypothetical protein
MHAYTQTPYIYTYVCLFVCLFLAQQPPVGHGLIPEVSGSHTRQHHSRWDSSGQVISSSQGPLPDNTHNIHNRQTSMPPVEFEPTISTSERPQTYALDRAATRTGSDMCVCVYIYIHTDTYKYTYIIHT